MSKFFLLALLATLISSTSRADIDIVTTIKPLQLIAQAVVGDHGTVNAILDPQQSPHHFTLSPSDRIALARTDLALWIGPEFETFLADFFAQAEISKKSITVIKVENLRLHSLEGGQRDAHLWLDSGNALRIAEALLARVAHLDPENAQAYRDNLESFRAEIDGINAEIAQRFRAPPQASYAVYHHAYQYFEKQFGLQHDMVILRDPETQPSIREIVALRAQIAALAPSCLLLEFDSSRELVNTVLNGHEMTLITVDLLGAGAEGFGEFMLKLADDFYSCLYE